ncbi:MAG: hypothetical protein K1X79_10540 [Oligoflexia bacterium]|nr:hypothetical protein [Oligoflexia bacterium]
MKLITKLCLGLGLFSAISAGFAAADIKEGMTEVDNQYFYIHAEFMRGTEVALVVSSLNGHPAPVGSVNMFGQATWDLCAPPEQSNSIYQLFQDQIAVASPELLTRLNSILFSEMNLDLLCQPVTAVPASPIFPFWQRPMPSCQGSGPSSQQGTVPPTPTPSVPLMTNLTPDELAALQIDFEKWWSVYIDKNHPCHVSWTAPSGTTPGKWSCDTAQRCLNQKQNKILTCQAMPNALAAACTCAWQAATQLPGYIVTLPEGDVPCVCGGGGCTTTANAQLVVTTSFGNQGLPPAVGGGTRRLIIKGNCVTTGRPVMVDNCFCPG